MDEIHESPRASYDYQTEVITSSHSLFHFLGVFSLSQFKLQTILTNNFQKSTTSTQ